MLPPAETILVGAIHNQGLPYSIDSHYPPPRPEARMISFSAANQLRPIADVSKMTACRQYHSLAQQLYRRGNQTIFLMQLWSLDRCHIKMKRVKDSKREACCKPPGRMGCFPFALAIYRPLHNLL